MPPGFYLRKWYFDLAADDGTTWIGYAGEVGTRSWHFSFSSSFLPSVEADAKTSLTFAEPSREGGCLSWSSAPLGCRYSISADCASFEKQLYAGGDGAVNWSCAIPSGDATLDARDTKIRGRGYAECLEMTLPPWKLPIRELRWGRFCGRQSLAWIQWTGPQPVDVAFLNGAPVSPQNIDDQEVLVEGCRLALRDDVVLRDARIARTLRAIGPIRRLLPQSLMSSREVKWRSRGVMEIDGSPADEGWVLHERVTFAAD